MVKKLSFFIVAMMIVASLVAQEKQLIVKGSDKSMYVEHTIAPKEGMYSIGRLYNVNPKHIAAFNKVDLNKGLNIGDVIRIPLSDTNFTQRGPGGAPVYYVVGEKDGLLSVSNSNKKIALQKLRDWNQLSSDKLAPGQRLIVGYLNTKDGAVAKVDEKPVEKKDIVEKPVQNKEIARVDEKPAAKTEIEEKPVIKNDKPVQKPVDKTETKVKDEEVRKVVPAPDATSNDAGYFKTSFQQQSKNSGTSKNETVTSGIFKTTSGWQDGKYYVLIDKVSPGTIVQLTNPDNNKAIYAKVLGEMNGIRQNQGLDIRVSNAGASALGIPDPEKFILKVNY